ncbi:MAG: heavy metal translocating P-type ATPase [Ignavibacteriae bacterium]|nr:heavy metal translocating P-type ATPase [Ignavibacteriota bacterium]
MKSHTTTFVVNDLCCSTEELLIRKKLKTVAGTEVRGINLAEKTVSVHHTCLTNNILNAFNEVGFKVELLNDVIEEQSFWKLHGVMVMMISSSVLLLTGFLFSFVIQFEFVATVVFILSIFLSGWNVLRKGVRAAKNFSLDMNFLMTIATIGAIIINKLEEAAVVMFLFALAELLEQLSLKRSRGALRSLMSLTPETAIVLRDGKEVVANVRDIHVEERILIRPGERIPLDGIVVSGASSVNQAQITGESKPSAKNIGDEVFAGSLNERGTLELEVRKPYSDTMLARVIRLVENAQSSRAPMQNTVEQFARYYSPAIFLLACCIALIPPLVFRQPFDEWVYRALVLLVIACPCALVLSTPVTIMSGLTNALRHGVLIKGGKFLELLGRIRAIAFDKTGTLTKGTPVVTDIISFNSLSAEEILKITASVESKSEHHFANAVIQKANEHNTSRFDMFVHSFESLPGKGVRAIVDGQLYVVGNHSLIEEMNICNQQTEYRLEELEREGKSTVILATEQEPLGVIAIADEMRTDAPHIIKRLHDDGMSKIILLTGDTEAIARPFAARVGIDEVWYQILPEEKLLHINRLKEKYNTVAMVGDGVNDAPALASATVGIAMGKTGTDVSLEASDVVLMSDELLKLPHIISLSKKTLSIIKQNIAIALLTKLVFLVLGMFGVATLWMAIIADDGATLVVILNGLRVLRFKPKNE